MSYIIFDNGPLGDETPWIYSEKGEPIAVAIMDLDVATRQEWLEMRKWGLGGSDLGSIMGEQSYKSAAQVNETKGPDAKIKEFDNDAMKWGRILEAPVAQFATEQLNCRTVRFPYMVVSLAHPVLLANVDYLVTDTFEYPKGEISEINKRMATNIDWILEVKTTGITGKPNDLAAGIIPKNYQSQLVHYAITLGTVNAKIAALVGQHGLKVIDGNITGRDIEKAYQAAFDWAISQPWYESRVMELMEQISGTGA